MVAANGTHHNGTNGHAKVTYLPCESDYPAIDVTPSQPQPKWRDQFPQFSHNVSWVDADGCAQSLTLRSDSLQDLLSDLKLLKGMIRQAKQQHSAADREQSQSDSQQTDVQHCPIHNCDMPRRWSKRTNGHYFGHKAPDGSFCYGRKA